MISALRKARGLDEPRKEIDGISMAVTLNSYKAGELTERETRDMLMDIGVAGLVADRLMLCYAPPAAEG